MKISREDRLPIELFVAGPAATNRMTATIARRENSHLLDSPAALAWAGTSGFRSLRLPGNIG